MIKKKSFSYKDSGVDIDISKKLVDQIKDIAKNTHRSEILSKLGAFSALCELPNKYSNPILVSSVDGVGTKLRLAIETNRHSSIGIDLVAMCVNDLIVSGAEPLFFLDYFSTGKLDINIAIDFIRGLSEGCLQAGCALVGGETAEMPEMYRSKNYDIAGFCVGIVEKSKIIDVNKVVNDDILIALSSNGLHSNGYSLVRKIIKVNNYNIFTTKLDDKLIIDHLLFPTRIYVNSILELVKNVEVHAIAHITGGGLLENIPRILPDNTQAIINQSSWRWPIIFQWLKRAGNISSYEMYRTFNCGIGMVIILPKDQENKAIEIMKIKNENAWKVGVIKHNHFSNERVIFI